MIKLIKVFVETDVPTIHLLNDNGFNVGQGTINGEEVYMMEVKTGVEKDKYKKEFKTIVQKYES